ncbi:hypothetical protein JCM9957A_70740 [Kineosporia succinea]
MTLTSAFGCALRTLRSNGSSRGLLGLRAAAPSRAMRENTRTGETSGSATRGRGSGAAFGAVVERFSTVDAPGWLTGTGGAAGAGTEGV